MQTKTQSLYESLTNVIVGYFISLLSLVIILPLLGIESSTSKNLLISFYFTFLSILRSYVLRRYFNGGTRLNFKPVWNKFYKKLESWGSAAAWATRR